MNSEESSKRGELAGETYVLTPVYEPPAISGLRRGSVTYLPRLWRRKWLILSISLLLPALMVIHSAFSPAVYQARATLLVQPPQFSSELRPEPFSVETYRSIIDSDYIAALLRNRLIENGQIRPEMTLERLKQNTRVEIFANKETDRPGAKPFMPLLELVAEAASAEAAAQIANTWAQICASENIGLAGKATDELYKFIETQYSSIGEALSDKETTLRQREGYYAGATLHVAEKWSNQLLRARADFEERKRTYIDETDRLLTDFSNETSRLRGDYEDETRRLLADFASEHQPEILKQELSIKKSKLGEFQNDLLGAELKIQGQADVLSNIKEQIKGQPRFLILAKAITDEALWSRIGTDETGQIPQELEKLKLRSELLNPSYQALLGRLIQAQIEYDSLVPGKQHLTDQIEIVSAEIDKLQKLVGDTDVAYEKLLAERRLGLDRLISDRTTEAAKLSRQRQVGLSVLNDQGTSELALLEERKDSETSELERDRALETKRLSREVTALNETYTLISGKYGSAQIAKSEEYSDVTIGAAAVKPDSPTSRIDIPAVLIAFLIAFLCMIGAVLAYETVSGLSKVRDAGDTEPQREGGEPSIAFARRSAERH